MDDFFAELTGPLFRYLLCATRNRDLAADLTQETLLRAWRNRTSLKQIASRRAWAMRIAANLWRDHCRAAGRRDGELAAPELIHDRRPSPERQASEREFDEAIAAAMRRLPDRQREAMHLSVVEQLSPSEIADVLQTSPGAVRSNLSAARKTLRVALQREVETGDDEETPPKRRAP